MDIPCKVCQDHSSGKHYGIYACDGYVPSPQFYCIIITVFQLPTGIKLLINRDANIVCIYFTDVQDSLR